MSGDAFVGLQRIKFLNLEGNSIKAIGGNTLAHLSGCIILDLRNDYFYPSTIEGGNHTIPWWKYFLDRFHIHIRPDLYDGYDESI